MWQSPNMNLDVAINHLKVFLKWLDEYRKQGFESALVTGKKVAEEIGLSEMTFKSTRWRQKRRLFDYEAADEKPELSQKDRFKISYFYVVVDTIRTSCKPRFEALKSHENNFGFLYDKESFHYAWWRAVKQLQRSTSYTIRKERTWHRWIRFVWIAKNIFKCHGRSRNSAEKKRNNWTK